MGKSIVTNDGIRLFIELPIIVPQSAFDAFDIIRFPTKIPSTQNYTIMKNNIPIVALSKEHYSYIPLSTNDLVSCSPVPSLACVKNFSVWSTAGAPSCELSVVLKHEKGIAEKCSMLIIKSRKEQILTIEDRTWAYFFPEPVTVRFDCINEYTNPKPFVLVGSGTLVVPLHCATISKSFKIRHSIRGNSSLTTELPSFHPLL